MMSVRSAALRGPANQARSVYLISLGWFGRLVLCCEDRHADAVVPERRRSARVHMSGQREDSRERRQNHLASDEECFTCGVAENM